MSDLSKVYVVVSEWACGDKFDYAKEFVADALKDYNPTVKEFVVKNKRAISFFVVAKDKDGYYDLRNDIVNKIYVCEKTDGSDEIINEDLPIIFGYRSHKSGLVVLDTCKPKYKISLELNEFACENWESHLHADEAYEGTLLEWCEKNDDLLKLKI